MNLKKYVPQSLFARTLLIILIPVLLLQITVSIVFFERHWSKMTERLAYSVAGDIDAVITMINQNPNDVEHIQKIQEISSHHFNLQISYHVGVQDFPTAQMIEQPLDKAKELLKRLSKKSSYKFEIITQPEMKRIVLYVDLGHGVLTVHIPEGRLYSASSYIFILWVMGLSALLFSISMLFMRNQIRPIHRLGIIAERLGRGIPVGKIKPTGAKEVRQAAEAFMNMQERINQFIEQRTLMLAGVSHDLRTPLTRMKLQIELLDDSKDKEALSGDIHDMEQMIGGYLSFAKGDGGEEMQRIAFDEMFNKIIDDAKRLNLDVTIKNDINNDVMIWAKPQALVRAFGNFLSNASRFASQVDIKTQIDESFIQIIIADNGCGIPDDKVLDMVKPFVRGDASRNQKTGGVGLGLTIAQDIIVAHGGTMTLQKSQTLGGLEIIVTLPL